MLEYRIFVPSEWTVNPVPTFNFASSTNLNELSDLSKLTEVIPETPWNSTSSLNVAIPETCKLSNVPIPAGGLIPVAPM